MQPTSTAPGVRAALPPLLLLLLVPLLAVVALAPGCASPSHGTWIRLGEGGSFHRYDGRKDPPEQEVVWTRRGVTTSALTAGEIELAADARAVLRLDPDAYLSLRQEWGGTERTLLIEAGEGGAPRYRYARDGAAADFDEEARAWFADLLPEVARRTAIGASARARGLLESGGVEALLAGAEELEDGLSRRIYVDALLRWPELSDGQLAEVARRGAALLESDSARSEVLGELADRAPEDRELSVALARASRSIESSSRRADLLCRIAEGRPLDDDGLRACIEAASTIPSASERQRVLLALLEPRPLGPEVEAAWLEVVGDLGSSSLQSQALDALLATRPVSARTLAAAARACGSIASTSERARIVSRVLRDPVADAAALADALDVVAELSSSSLQQTALEELLDRRGLERATLRRAADVAARIPSASARAAVQDRILALLLAAEEPGGDRDQ